MKDIKIYWLFGLSMAGVLFSGYMSGVKLFFKTCAFNESCPYFLGYPACYFGFGLFFILLVLSLLLVIGKIEHKTGIKTLNYVALAGVLFAGYFALQDLPVLFDEGLGGYVLGLPTCILGFLFFLAIFILSEITKKRYFAK